MAPTRNQKLADKPAQKDTALADDAGEDLVHTITTKDAYGSPIRADITTRRRAEAPKFPFKVAFGRTLHHGVDETDPFDRTHYRAGDTVQLTAKDAKRLASTGFIVGTEEDINAITAVDVDRVVAGRPVPIINAAKLDTSKYGDPSNPGAVAAREEAERDPLAELDAQDEHEEEGE